MTHIADQRVRSLEILSDSTDQIHFTFPFNDLILKPRSNKIIFDDFHLLSSSILIFLSLKKELLSNILYHDLWLYFFFTHFRLCVVKMCDVSLELQIILLVWIESAKNIYMVCIIHLVAFTPVARDDFFVRRVRDRNGFKDRRVISICSKEYLGALSSVSSL